MFNLTDKTNSQVFYSNNASWQLWNKPTNAKMIYIFAIGGGSGGGGGRTVVANSSPGGGGGASSSIAVATYQASLLPDQLYVQVGLGGLGGVANTTGSAGSLSYVTYRPDTTAINILLKSGDVAATAGTGAFSTTGVGAGGTGGTAWSFTTAVNGSLGLVTVTPGQNGTSGTGVGGSPQSITPILCVTGGAGGGASSAAATAYVGGSIIGSGFLNTIPSGVLNAADASINGNDGYTTLLLNNVPEFFTGGSGGAGASTSGRQGGTGGNGSFGSGGGGGGGTYNGTGGTGGKGGDGLIIIAYS